MKLLIVTASIALAFAAAASARGSGGGSHSIRAHVTKNGTYVAPAHATNPNSTTRDNWSTKPNVNPYTGATGTKLPKP